MGKLRNFVIAILLVERKRKSKKEAYTFAFRMENLAFMLPFDSQSQILWTTFSRTSKKNSATQRSSLT